VSGGGAATSAGGAARHASGSRVTSQGSQGSQAGQHLPDDYTLHGPFNAYAWPNRDFGGNPVTYTSPRDSHGSIQGPGSPRGASGHSFGGAGGKSIGGSARHHSHLQPAGHHQGSEGASTSTAALPSYAEALAGTASSAASTAAAPAAPAPVAIGKSSSIPRSPASTPRKALPAPVYMGSPQSLLPKPAGAATPTAATVPVLVFPPTPTHDDQHAAEAAAAAHGTEGGASVASAGDDFGTFLPMPPSASKEPPAP